MASISTLYLYRYRYLYRYLYQLRISDFVDLSDCFFIPPIFAPLFFL